MRRLYSTGVVLWPLKDLWAFSIPLSKLPDGTPMVAPPDEGTPGGKLAKKHLVTSMGRVKMLPPEVVNEHRRRTQKISRYVATRGVPTPFGEAARYCTLREYEKDVKPVTDRLSREFEAWRDSLVAVWDTEMVPKARLLLEEFGEYLWRRHDPLGFVDRDTYVADFVAQNARHIPPVEEVQSSVLGCVAAHVDPRDHRSVAATTRLAESVADHQWVKLRDAAVFVHKLCESRAHMDYGGPVQFVHGAKHRFTAALRNCALWDPCPELSRDMYSQARQVPEYLRALSSKLYGLDPGALQQMMSVVSPLLPVLFSAKHRQSRVDFLLAE